MFSDRTDLSKAYGMLLDSSHAKRLEKIENLFIKFGFSCCLPHRDEGQWGREYFQPGPLSSLCLRHVETSDIIFAIAERGRGVHVELGFASAFPDKKLILMYKEGTEPSTLIWGLTNDFSPWEIKSKTRGNMVIQSYKNDEDLLNKTHQILINRFKYKEHNTIRLKRHIGTIDIGSHTLKLKIFSYSKGGVANLIYKENESLAIIDDVLNDGSFSNNTIDKLIQYLTKCKEKCKDFSCERIVLTGTAALRKAKNTQELLIIVKKKLELDIDLIDAKKELSYLYSAVVASFFTSEKIGVLGLGGGSTQIGIGTTSKLENKYFLDFGTNLISKKWSWDKSFSTREYNEIVKYVKDNFKRNVPNVIDVVENLVYTGGETEFMLKCQLPLTVTNMSPIHVSKIDINSFKVFCYQFANLDPKAVFDKFHLDPKWAIGSIAANTIALITAEMFGVKNIIPSNFNISNGILLTIK